MVAVCMLMCRRGQWLGPNSDSWGRGRWECQLRGGGGARPVGGDWRARAGTEKTSTGGPAGRRSSNAQQAGARGEEVSAFRPPGRRPSGESPPTPAARCRIGGTGRRGEIWVAGAPEGGGGGNPFRVTVALGRVKGGRVLWGRGPGFTPGAKPLIDTEYRARD